VAECGCVVERGLVTRADTDEVAPELADDDPCPLSALGAQPTERVPAATAR